MPIGYLVAASIVAAAAWLAVSPPMPEHTNPSNPTYFVTVGINELPYVVGAWVVVATVVELVGGDLTTPVGLAGLTASVAALVALVIIARRGLDARRAVMAALDEGLPAPSPMRRDHPWPKILFRPLSMPGRRVRRDTNIAYGPHGRRNLLDVYHDDHPSGQVLVYFHGGGFRSGNKRRQARSMLHRLARRGWVCVSANYRLAPEASSPDFLVDAERVLAWTASHAGEYGGRSDRVWATGSSAGGWLALMVALRPQFDVRGAATFGGYFGSPDADEPTTPGELVHADAPPAFVAHGDQDTIVVVDDARRFVRRLAEVSDNPVVYAELPGSQHGFDLFSSARFEAVIDGFEAFSASVDRAR